MLGAVAIIPSAPVLVPQLAGAAAAELVELREAVVAAASALPARWIAVGAGRADGLVGPDSVGTFAGFGAELPVRLSPGDGERGESPPVSPHAGAPPAELPLCALITGWVREQARPQARAEVRVYAGDHCADAAVTLGRQLRAHLDQIAEPAGVLIVADGANTLTAAAPGGYHPGDVDVQRALDDALACGDAAALSRLPEQVGGRVPFAVLAGLAEPGPRGAKELYRGAPYGVGYFAGVWQP